MTNLEALHRRAKALNLHGLLAHWEEAAAAGWLATLIDWEEQQERTRRSLEHRPFAEWREVFPNAACVVSLVDRLVHNAEVLAIEGESYRLKEAQERADQRARQRRKAKS